MTSPFYEAPGIHTYGDITYEWLPLLKTPCYGFNGPNACYSSTCEHNPTLSESKQQLSKPNLTKSTKLSFKLSYNGQRKSSGDRVSVQKSSLTVHTNSFAYQHKSYEEFELKYNGSDDCNDGESSGSPVYSDDLQYDPMNELNIHCEQKSHFYRHDINSLSPSPSLQSFESCSDTASTHSSQEAIASAKKYTFNPLSEPFQPAKKCCSTVSSPHGSPEGTTIDDFMETSATPIKSILPSNQPAKPFVCILCPEKYATLDELQEHLKTKVMQPHVCIVCGASYAHYYLLQRHLKGHHSLKTISCRGCYKTFRNMNQLRKHIEFCPYKLYLFI